MILTGILRSILIQSDNYVAGSKGLKINLNNGTIDSKNFKLDANGNMDITAKITAGSGDIAGWKIESGGLKKTFTKTFGPFTASDETIATSFILGTATPTAADIIKYDITGDGQITTLDLAYIHRIVLGVSTGTFDYEIMLNSTDPSKCIKATMLENGVVRVSTILGTGGMIAPTITASDVYVEDLIVSGNVKPAGKYGANGTFTSSDGKTVTVTSGIVTSIT